MAWNSLQAIVATLTHCKFEEITALELALQHKGDLTALASLNQSVSLREGLSVGAVYSVYQIAKKMTRNRKSLREYLRGQGGHFGAVKCRWTHGAGPGWDNPLSQSGGC